MFRKGLLSIVILFLVAVLVACGGASNTGGGGGGESTTPASSSNTGSQASSSSGTAQVEEYKIGAIYSKTGPNSPLGEPEWNTTLLLVEKINAEGGINGVPLKVILADDESTQEKATQEINRLINDEQVLAVLGSSGSGESLAMKGVAMQLEVPMISAGASMHIVEPASDAYWVFKTPQSDIHAVQRIYIYLQEQGISNVATLVDSNAFGTSGLEQLEKQAPDYGINIVAKESYNTQDPDMSAQLTRINSSGAEVVIVWGTNPGPAIIARNIQELGIDLPMVSSHGIANQTFLDLAGEAAENVVIPTGRLLFPEQIPESDPQYEVISSFYEEYVAKFNSEPTNFASYGYDNLMLVVEALKAGATDRVAIRDYLENEIKDWVGATGIFNFTPDDHNGLSADSLVMATVKDGKWVLLE